MLAPDRFHKAPPIPVKERTPWLFLRKGKLQVEDSSLIFYSADREKYQIPAERFCAIILERGVRVSSDAVMLCADCGTIVIWAGDGGVRFYSACTPKNKTSKKLLWQASLFSNPESRTKIARAMFRYRFGDELDVDEKSIQELMGLEGIRVQGMYRQLAKAHGMKWEQRYHGHGAIRFEDNDLINKCITAANLCLYGICECAIVAAGLSPAIGFVHCGKMNSFVLDIADLYKMTISVPAAFKTAASNPKDPSAEVRYVCRDFFRQEKLLGKIVNTTLDILSAGEMPEPDYSEDEDFVFLEDE